MDEYTQCCQCHNIFHHDDGELHPTLDAIICPHYSAVNMSPNTSPYTWEDLQEDIRDQQFHASHNAPGI